MPTCLLCPRGHRWELDDEEPTGDPAAPVACPFCGALCGSSADAAADDTGGGTSPGPMQTWDATGSAQTGTTTPDLPRVPGYEVLGVLGRGGMGAVYRARQVKTDRIVALKVPHAASLDLRVRFMTEAKAVARLQHPNIAQVFEVGEADRVPYMALEFCPGGPLADHLDGTPLPPREAAELAAVIARAVAAAHAAGIVHRDLKPANILLATTGDGPLYARSPKVADFGLARLFDLDAGHTHSGAVIGTPSYMAPEQARGDIKHVGPGADVYALGSVLYHLLTGRPPFRGTTAVETRDQVCTREPVPPARVQPHIPRDLETVTLTCLRKEPERRYLTADALADDLRRFLDGRPIQARPVGWPERLVKTVRRHPLPAALLAALVAVVVGGAVWGVWERFRLVAERDRARGHYQLSMRAIEGLLTEVGEQELAAEPRAEQTRRKLLEKALAFYGELLAREAGDPAVRWEAARATRRVGDIRRQLGDYPAALDGYAAALARLDALRLDGFDPPDRRAEVAHCHNWRGEVYRLTERLAEADDDYQRAIAGWTALAADDPRYRLALAQSLYNRGIVAGSRRQFAAAKDAFRDARQVLDKATERPPEHRRHAARVGVNLADVLAKDGKPADAAAAADDAAGLLRALAQEFPARHEFRHELAVARLNGVVARVDLGDATAAPVAAEARGLLEELARDFPSIAVYRVDLAKVCTAQAAAEFSADPGRARQHTLAAVGHWEAVIAAQRGVPSHHGDLAIALGNLAQLAALAADPADARRHGGRSVVEFLTALRANPNQPDFQTELAAQTRALAERYVGSREDEAACRLAGEVSRAFPDGSRGTYWAVCFLARCAAAVSGDEAARRADEFARRTVELIRAGNASDLAPLLADPDCDPFRHDPGFRAAFAGATPPDR